MLRTKQVRRLNTLGKIEKQLDTMVDELMSLDLHKNPVLHLTIPQKVGMHFVIMAVREQLDRVEKWSK